MKPTKMLIPAVTAALLAAAAAAPAVGRAQVACHGEPGEAKLHVFVDGVRSDQGIMTLTLYGDDPAKFLKRSGELKVWRDDARSPTTEVCLWLPGPGTYAVAVYHDAKRAGRFTQGAFGIPTQDFGFSRNPRIFLGPPSLNASKFDAGEGETTIHIKLKYP
jgi:uncharacterized protein (DUF2141 family)